MKTGVVLEINGPSAVVLDGSGSFRTVSTGIGWRTGDVVTLNTPRRRSMWTLPLAACLTAAVLGGGFLWLDETSLVSLDVNPSVELGLNRFERVVSVTARNDEGAVLLDVAEVKGKTAGEAVTELLESSYLSPYLEESGCVSLSVQSSDDALVTRLQTAAGVGRNYLVECHRVDAATVEQAHHYGVTAGKYLALLELQAADPELDISTYTHCGIGEIKAETKRCLEDGHNQPNIEPSVDTETSCGNGYGYGYGYGGGHHGGGHHNEN